MCSQAPTFRFPEEVRLDGGSGHLATGAAVDPEDVDAAWTLKRGDRFKRESHLHFVTKPPLDPNNEATFRPDNVREKELKDKGATSVRLQTATAGLFCCFFYNWFCCCPPFRWCGPWMGSKFCFSGNLNCYTVELRRDRWLWLAHIVCFCIHTGWAVEVLRAAAGNDMNVEILRVKPSWQFPGQYGFTLEAAWFESIRFDILCFSFFFLSALAHGMWVFLGWNFNLSSMLWRHLDNCLCWWRWLECPPQLNTSNQTSRHTRPLSHAHLCLSLRLDLRLRHVRGHRADHGCT